MLHKLQKKFTKKHCLFKQVGSGFGWYIYKVYIPNEDKDAQKYSIHYEYFRIKTRVETIDFTNRIVGDTYEEYPWDEAFGAWAWCCTSLEYALKDIQRKDKLKSKFAMW